MKIVITDTFVKSLEKLVARQRWHWKIYEFFRYDLVSGIKNLVFFFPVIWNFRGWDSAFQMKLLRRSLEPLRDSIANGNEISKTADKKVQKIERLMEILDNITEDRYIEIAEEKLGLKVDSNYIFDKDEPVEIAEANSKIFSLSRAIEEDEFQEFAYILKGQDPKEFEKYKEEHLKEDDDLEKSRDIWDDFYDGSCILRWWS